MYVLGGRFGGRLSGRFVEELDGQLDWGGNVRSYVYVDRCVIRIR